MHVNIDGKTIAVATEEDLLQLVADVQAENPYLPEDPSYAAWNESAQLFSDKVVNQL